MSRQGRVWQEGRKKGEPAIKGREWYFVIDDRPVAGKRKQIRRRGFPTQKAAQEALAELVGNVRAGRPATTSRAPLADYLTAWIEGLPAAGRRATTIASYRKQLERYVLRDDIATIPLGDVAPLDLSRLYSDLSKRVSMRTVRYVHSIVGKALADAERQELIHRNPARLANAPATSATRAPEMAVWTPAELSRFLELAGGHHHGALLRLASMSGLRRGELCGLRWADVDLDGKHLSVRQTITSIGTELVIGAPKTARSRRTIDLDDATVAVLRTHRTRHLEERLLMGAGYRDNGLVFAMPTGEPWKPDTISQAFDRLVASSGLPRIHLHSLRHTHATHLLAAGVNVKVVSERLGHASVAFTLDVYGHVLPGQQADAAAAVAMLVDGGAR